MNSRLTLLGAVVALPIALGTACGQQTAVPDDLAPPARIAQTTDPVVCSSAPDIVLRRTRPDHSAPRCHPSGQERAGYPGAAGQPLG